MKTCLNCNRDALYQCSACKSVFYCSDRCADIAWLEGHNKACDVHISGKRPNGFDFEHGLPELVNATRNYNRYKDQEGSRAEENYDSEMDKIKTGMENANLSLSLIDINRFENRWKRARDRARYDEDEIGRAELKDALLVILSKLYTLSDKAESIANDYAESIYFEFKPSAQNSNYAKSLGIHIDERIKEMKSVEQESFDVRIFGKRLTGFDFEHDLPELVKATRNYNYYKDYTPSDREYKRAKEKYDREMSNVKKGMENTGRVGQVEINEFAKNWDTAAGFAKNSRADQNVDISTPGVGHLKKAFLGILKGMDNAIKDDDVDTGYRAIRIFKEISTGAKTSDNAKSFGRQLDDNFKKLKFNDQESFDVRVFGKRLSGSNFSHDLPRLMVASGLAAKAAIADKVRQSSPEYLAKMKEVHSEKENVTKSMMNTGSMDGDISEFNMNAVILPLDIAKEIYWKESKDAANKSAKNLLIRLFKGIFGKEGSEKIANENYVEFADEMRNIATTSWKLTPVSKKLGKMLDAEFEKNEKTRKAALKKK